MTVWRNEEGLLTDVIIRGLGLAIVSLSLGFSCHMISQVPLSSNMLQILISFLLGESILVKKVNPSKENFVISQHISIMFSFILVTTQKGKRSDILGKWLSGFRAYNLEFVRTQKGT